MTAPIDLVLSQLDKVRQRQPGQWSACCPAHDDKGPSLSVRETPEGSVLLHCFGGCDFAEVVAALGLEPTDLYPPRERSGREPKKRAKVLTAHQALELLSLESVRILIVARDLLVGRAKPEDIAGLSQAVSRIAVVNREYTGGQHA